MPSVASENIDNGTMSALNSSEDVQTNEEERINQGDEDDYYFNDGDAAGEDDDEDCHDFDQFSRKTVRVTNFSSDKFSVSKTKRNHSTERKKTLDPYPDSINAFLIKQCEVTISDLQSEILSLKAELSSTKKNLHNLEELCSSKRSLPCGCVCVCSRETSESCSTVKHVNKNLAAQEKVEAPDAKNSKDSSVADELAARDERIAQLEGSLIEMSMKLAMSKSVQDEYRLKSRRRSSNISTTSCMSTPKTCHSGTPAATNPCKRHSDFIPRSSSKLTPGLAIDGTVNSSVTGKEIKESYQKKCNDGNVMAAEEGNFAIRKLMRGFRSRQHGQVQTPPNQTGQRQLQQSQTQPNNADKHERSFSLNFLDKLFSNEIQTDSSPATHHDNGDGVADSSHLTLEDLIDPQVSSKPMKTPKSLSNEEQSRESSSSLKNGARGYFKGFTSSRTEGNGLTDKNIGSKDIKGSDDCSDEARGMNRKVVDDFFDASQVKANPTICKAIVDSREEGDCVVWGSDSPKMQKLASKTVKNRTHQIDASPPFSEGASQISLRRQISEPTHSSLKSHKPKSQHRSSISSIPNKSNGHFQSTRSTGENANDHSAHNYGDLSQDLDRSIETIKFRSLKNTDKQLSSSAVYSRNVGQYLNEIILKERKNVIKNNERFDVERGNLLDHNTSTADGSFAEKAGTKRITIATIDDDLPNSNGEEYQDIILPTKQPHDISRTRKKQHVVSPLTPHLAPTQSIESNQYSTKCEQVKIRRMTSDPYHTTDTKSQKPNQQYSLRRSSANGSTRIQSSGQNDSNACHQSRGTESIHNIRERRQALTDGDDDNNNKNSGRNVSFQPQQIKPSRRMLDKRLSSSVAHSRNVGLFLNEMISSRKITKSTKVDAMDEKPMDGRAPSQKKTLAESYFSTGAETMTTVATADDELDLSISFREDKDNRSDVQFLLPNKMSRHNEKSAPEQIDSRVKRRERLNSVSSSITDSVVFPESMADVLKASMIDFEED